MATVDPRTDTVVIRVVYDGVPMAGKTTSVRALGRGLGGEVYSPAELSGRTLYFDWLDYTGGLFEGRRIRCQIISVPGQASLAPRREKLLRSADAIVFVGDSTPSGFAADRGYLGGLQDVLADLPGPPVGIVFQANKRDDPHAVPIDAVRSMLEELGLRVGIVESIAKDSTGIREAFVFAVRLALDRVRGLMGSGDLTTRPPDVDNARELLEELKREEQGPLDYAEFSDSAQSRLTEVQADSLAANSLLEALREPTAATGSDEPLPPDAAVGSGMIWPPVDGRMVLHELTQAPIELTCSRRGDWSGVANGRWRLHSEADAVYGNPEEGRAVLLLFARMQAPVAKRVGALPRCFALAADGHGRFRLWRIDRIS